MDPKEKLAALAKEAQELRAKSQTDDWTDADTERAEQVAKEYEQVSAAVVGREKASKALETMLSFEKEQQENSENGVEPRKFATFGEAFVNSAEYKALQEKYPRGIAKDTPIKIEARNMASKAYRAKLLTSPVTGNAAPVRNGDVDDLVYRAPRTLLDVVTHGTTALPWIQYRQVISKTNNAAIVAEATTSADPVANTTTGVLEYPAGAGLKPLSTLTTTVAEAKAYTYADGMEVTNQELTDDGIIQALINSTLTENLDILVEDILLNGTGVGEEPKGILATTGILQQAFVTDMPTSIRKAITKLRTTSGAQIRGVLLNPADNEAWDLLKDTTGRYLGNGPFNNGPGGAWGYERIESQAIPVGQALMGDFKTIHLLGLEALAIQAFNQHKDFAQRNLVYIRAELRAMQLIRNAAKLCVVDLAA